MNCKEIFDYIKKHVDVMPDTDPSRFVYTLPDLDGEIYTVRPTEKDLAELPDDSPWLEDPAILVPSDARAALLMIATELLLDD